MLIYAINYMSDAEDIFTHLHTSYTNTALAFTNWKLDYTSYNIMFIDDPIT